MRITGYHVGMTGQSEMHRRVLSHLLLIALPILIAGPAFGSWDPVVRLSNTNSASAPATTPLTVRSPYVHVLWIDGSYAPHGVVYCRSTDDGATWGPAVQMSGMREDPWDEYAGLLCGTGGNLLGAYESSGCAVLRRSTNNGATWNNSTTLADGVGDLKFSVAPNGNAFVCWSTSWCSLFVRRSTNGGATWLPQVLIGTSTGLVHSALVSPTNTGVCFLFENSDSVCAVSSTNSGASWGPVSLLATSPYSFGFDVAADGRGRVHILWTDDHTGSPEVYYACSTDNGVTWSNAFRMTTSTESWAEWMVAAQDTVYVAYENLTTGMTRRRSFDGGANWEAESNWPVYWNLIDYTRACVSSQGWVHFIGPDGYNTYSLKYCRSRNAGSTWSDTATVSPDDGLQRYLAAIATSNGYVHAVWRDYETGNFEIYYRRGLGLAGMEENDRPPASAPEFALTAKPCVVSHGTVLSYSLPTDGDLVIAIRDAGGRLVWSPPIRAQNAGSHSLFWDGRDNAGWRLSAGCYFCTLTSGAQSSRVKLLLLGESRGHNSR